MKLDTLRKERKAIFDHLRNLLICSVLMAVTYYSISHPEVLLGKEYVILGLVLSAILFILTVLLLMLNADEAFEKIFRLNSRLFGALMVPLYTLLIVLVGKSFVALRIGLSL